MTSLLTQADTTSSQLNPQQQAVEDNTVQIPKLNNIFESQFSNQAKPSSLLVKRFEATEFGDLLTKRVKTQSTNASENGSLQHSPTTKKNIEQDKISIDDSLSNTFTRCSSYESSQGGLNQHSFSASPVVLDLDPQSYMDESTLLLQQALDLLREKMIEKDAENILEMLFKAQMSQEPLYIPPLVENVSEGSKQGNKKEVKKMEIEDATYGSVEYPFLSFSTPYPENGDFSSIPKLDLSGLTHIVNDSAASLACNDPYLEEKVSAALSNVEKKEKKTFSIKRQRVATIKSPSQESTSSNESTSGRKKKIQAKEDKKVNGKKVIINKVIESVVQKKEDKKVNKETESSKTIKQDDEDIYSRPKLHSRRFTQRTKNRWQIAQDEKVKDIVLPALNFNGGYELFFAGNKKKAVPIGPEYQVEVSVAAVQNTTSTRRKPQLKWNPSSHKETELKKFFGKVESIVNGEINEEKVVGLILENKNDLKRALKYVQTHKSKCLEALRG